jgi:DNA polymerase III sliding clamp (beta) subunit (PCNA family)
MKIAITREELKTAVAGFQKIVNGKSRSLPILGGIRFESRDGTVTAQATDLDQHLIYTFKQAHCEDSGVFIIPLANLKDLTKGRAEESVEFACTGGKEDPISVTNHVGEHAVQHSVPGLDPAEWPASPPKPITRPAVGFLDAYRGMLPFVSHDVTRRVLTGVYIEAGTENACTLVATDGRRLTCSRSMELPVASSVVVPASKFLAWSGIGGEARIGLRTDKVEKGTRVAGFALETGPWCYDTRIIDGTYPNWRQVVPAPDNLTRRIVFHENDVGLMRRVLPTFPGGENINIACGADGSVTLAGHDKESGETRLPLQGSRHAGPGSRICVSRVFLQEALDAGFRDFGFAGNHSPLAARTGAGALHVLMPLKVDAGTENPEAQAAGETVKAEPETVQAPAVTNTHQTTPVAETQPATPKEKPMNQEKTTEPTALEKLQAAYDLARSRVREAQSALADVAAAIRDAVREDRQRRSEVENVRAGLARLQSIKV